MPWTGEAARADALELWGRITGLLYRASRLEAEDAAVSGLLSALREAAGIASAWAGHVPPSPAAGDVVGRFSEWASSVVGWIEASLSEGSLAEARRGADLLLEALRSTHRILGEETARYRLGFQIPLVAVAVMVSLAGVLGSFRGPLSLLASMVGAALTLSGAAATSFSPRLAFASMMLGGAAMLAALPPLETASIVGAGMVAAALSYMGLVSRRVSLILPRLPSPGEQEPGGPGDGDLEAMLEARYREVYGERWRSMLEYDISVLTQAGLTRREAMLRRLRELEG